MEDRQTRLKRLRIRSWRRGTKEMDLILGPYADQRMTELSDPALDLHERLLDQDDHDLYGWITARTRGEAAGPPDLDAALADVARFAGRSGKPGGA
ncbi:succinate dehydrogenase assembly factor 2 [Paracoccus sp. Z118]|uniref:FAD assembly factor SdhE n=1 Tax=Paracoccus sp. Z118 TaxID=2851017 RepID=UPI001C2C27B2|nr:succinate dehydrogenase assembly factor 2 [Paracoccus sp. Z118]MBV0891980.1 succinate dehydrogenase assembly factor 2 [Paracoccus sp. Z118]